MDGLTRTSGAPRRSTDLNRRTSFDVSWHAPGTRCAALPSAGYPLCNCCGSATLSSWQTSFLPSAVMFQQGPKAGGWNDGYQESTYFQSRGTAPYYDAKNSSHEDLTVLATSKDAPVRVGALGEVRARRRFGYVPVMLHILPLTTQARV